ncbi:TPA_asm: RNA-directed RNA polymerase [ssRNA phage SRR7976310_17]|uniref:RNA-directed RNA polymerase n=1 Tax=ssRNA phage SRR7976310_17 TaxID=2786679 RepID=A0A8S5L4U8_9VIRU|nr:RNA-directed RNA polymerase [ssRNA phage SRR7976310_17]DAD52726.1 TPA_asm: RNA-directed RNA polymerase [ssRNA phage SRR7976310_17]
MKSYLESCVVGVYGSLLKDFAYVHPSMDIELKRLSRFDSIVADRGLSFWTINMPDFCKFLERGLAEGRLPSDRPYLHGRVSKKDSRPSFLRGLWSLIFDEHGLLRSDASIDAIAALRQLYLFAKKLKLQCSEDRTNESIIGFKEVDQGLPPSHAGTWDDDVPFWVRRIGHPLWGVKSSDGNQLALQFGGESRVESIFTDRDWDTFRAMCASIVLSLGECDVFSMRPKHGPGAVADFTKVKYDMAHWPAKLAGVFPADWFASTDLVDRTSSVREFPSRVIPVPKTQKGPRIIASEPTSHQWCQGGIQRWFVEGINKSVLRDAIDLHDQEPSRKLALSASVDGSLATVDLSAASDRISTRLVEYMFQVNRPLLDALHATRTRWYVLPNGEHHVMRKFACMGSACTFPVQTVIFAMISIFALMKQSGDMSYNDSRLRKLAKHVRVFGDDIVLPSEAYDVLHRLLTELGLKVNPHKSFWSGYFRESCGMDAYRGQEVTPAYFLQPYNARNPESLISIVECSNNFHKKGMWNTADYLMKTVDAQVLKLLRVSNKDVSQPCLYSFVPGSPKRKLRWNDELQRVEVRQLVLQTKQELLEGSGNSALLQYFSEEPDPLLPYRSGQMLRPIGRITSGWEPAES